MNKALETPALDGLPVTEGHAKVCRDRGHMTHTVDGAEQGWCPRCGEVTAPAENGSESLFEARVQHYRARGEDYGTAYTWAHQDVTHVTRMAH